MAYWSSEHDEELLRLKQEKLSAAEIAYRLGRGLSRNAVIGRLHRLGIRDGKTVKKRVLKKKKAEIKRFTQLKRQPTVIDDWAPEEKRAVAPSPPRKTKSRIVCTEADSSLASVPLDVRMMDLTSNSCRWPVNDPEPKGEYLFCGHPKKYGSYCAHHAAMSVGQGTFAEAMADKLGWAA